MASNDRPSGLTALAVLHLVFGCWEGIKTLPLAIVYFAPVDGDRGLELLKSIPLLAFLVLIGARALGVILLFTSGIGCLMQRKRLGYWVGNMYVVVGLFTPVYTIRILPMGQTTSSLELVYQVFYPVFTAYLLNQVFRRDFVR